MKFTQIKTKLTAIQESISPHHFLSTKTSHQKVTKGTLFSTLTLASKAIIPQMKNILPMPSQRATFLSLCILMVVFPFYHYINKVCKSHFLYKQPLLIICILTTTFIKSKYLMLTILLSQKNLTHKGIQFPPPPPNYMTTNHTNHITSHKIIQIKNLIQIFNS